MLLPYYRAVVTLVFLGVYLQCTSCRTLNFNIPNATNIIISDFYNPKNWIENVIPGYNDTIIIDQRNLTASLVIQMDVSNSSYINNTNTQTFHSLTIYGSKQPNSGVFINFLNGSNVNFISGIYLESYGGDVSRASAVVRFLEGSKVSLQDCWISGITSKIYVQSSSFNIRNNLVMNKRSQFQGGDSVNIRRDVRFSITNVIINNSAFYLYNGTILDTTSIHSNGKYSKITLYPNTFLNITDVAEFVRTQVDLQVNSTIRANQFFFTSDLNGEEVETLVIAGTLICDKYLHFSGSNIFVLNGGVITNTSTYIDNINLPQMAFLFGYFVLEGKGQINIFSIHFQDSNFCHTSTSQINTEHLILKNTKFGLCTQFYDKRIHVDMPRYLSITGEMDVDANSTFYIDIEFPMYVISTFPFFKINKLLYAPQLNFKLSVPKLAATNNLNIKAMYLNKVLQAGAITGGVGTVELNQPIGIVNARIVDNTFVNIDWNFEYKEPYNYTLTLSIVIPLIVIILIGLVMLYMFKFRTGEVQLNIQTNNQQNTTTGQVSQQPSSRDIEKSGVVTEKSPLLT